MTPDVYQLGAQAVACAGAVEFARQASTSRAAGDIATRRGATFVALDHYATARTWDEAAAVLRRIAAEEAP